MQKFLSSIALAALAVAPYAAQGQMMSTSMYGAGPHGYDWEVGTWSCTNTMPSPMGGPTNTTLRVTRTSAGAIFYRSTGANFDNSWYNVYVPSKKMWVSPFIVSDGSYGTESTAQTGKKIVWTGSAYFAGSGKTMQIRDTNVIAPTKYSDLGEVRSGGTWKTQYNVSCTRT
jgi:hypothetical protein